jgi:Ni,Fe-hydrogenase maturation factor
MGMRLPTDKNFVIVAIEVEDVLNFGEQCTPAVEEAIPRAVDVVLAELEGNGAEPTERVGELSQEIG